MADTSVVVDDHGVPRRGDGQVLRGCDVCGGVDYHPKHVHTPNPDEPANPTQATMTAIIAAAGKAGATPDQLTWLTFDQMDPTNVVRHWDCCRDAGCPGGVCAENLARLGDVRHEALVQAAHGEYEALTGAEGAKRSKLLAQLPRQGLTAEQERAGRQAQRAALQAAVSDLDAADAAQER